MCVCVCRAYAAGRSISIARAPPPSRSPGVAKNEFARTGGSGGGRPPARNIRVPPREVCGAAGRATTTSLGVRVTKRRRRHGVTKWTRRRDGGKEAQSWRTTKAAAPGRDRSAAAAAAVAVNAIRGVTNFQPLHRRREGREW